MDKVGVRDLKQNASEVVSRVEHGESVVVTVNGRQVAVMSPIPRQSTWVSMNDALAVVRTQVDEGSWLDELNEQRNESLVLDPWDDVK